MKKDIHPPYYKDAKIACACGNLLTVGSTVESASVEICSACHPFYTGTQKFVDTAGRLERFQKRASKKTDAQAARKGKKAKNKVRSARKVVKKVEKQKSEK
ncbi:50S ribosomal protein L31 [Candidatus Uhrbacteria bacterium]|nr:50S ribosomal protein L31 [Candidatus Uhrbacteria bacterium]